MKRTICFTFALMLLSGCGGDPVADVAVIAPLVTTRDRIAQRARAECGLFYIHLHDYRGSS